MEDKIRRLIYLAESFKPWTPEEIVVYPWETGLLPSGEIKTIRDTTTNAIFRGIYDNTNDTR